MYIKRRANEENEITQTKHKRTQCENALRFVYAAQHSQCVCEWFWFFTVCVHLTISLLCFACFFLFRCVFIYIHLHVKFNSYSPTMHSVIQTILWLNSHLLTLFAREFVFVCVCILYWRVFVLRMPTTLRTKRRWKYPRSVSS